MQVSSAFRKFAERQKRPPTSRSLAKMRVITSVSVSRSIYRFAKRHSERGQVAVRVERHSVSRPDDRTFVARLPLGETGFGNLDFFQRQGTANVLDTRVL